MSEITTQINNETMIKLTRRAKRVGMTPEQAFEKIATKGVKFFLALLVGATTNA